MSRWVAKRMVALQLWARERGDGGQTSFEDLGIAVVIAVIIGVIAGTTSIGQAVVDGIIAKIGAIVGAG